MPARKPPREITRWSNQKNSGRSRGVTLISLHESVGITNAWDLALFCERKGVSYHDMADLTQLVHAVQFSDTAWHLRNGNPSAVGLCLASPVTGYTRAEWLGPQLAKVEYAAWWVARACKIYGLPIRHCNYGQIRSALRGNQADGGVITHDDYTQATNDGTHTDPRNFPIDVCLSMARGITSVPEDDMAQVPQAEWNDMLAKIRTMYGDRDPADRHTMRRVDGSLVRKLVEETEERVWDYETQNYVGQQVAMKHIIAALEQRMDQLGKAVLILLERTGGIPDNLSGKTLAGGG